jgi:hypothetical protein
MAWLDISQVSSRRAKGIMTLTIKGLQEAQEWNLRSIRNMKSSGTFGDMLREIMTQLHRYQVSITHVDSGALRAAERIEINGMTGRLFVDESASSPKGGKPSVYGQIEDARGGDHAFGRNTAEQGAPSIIMIALSRFGRSLT